MKRNLYLGLVFSLITDLAAEPVFPPQFNSCNCATYVDDGGEWIVNKNLVAKYVYPLEGLSCNQSGLLQCNNYCALQINNMTNGGDLDYTPPGSSASVGQVVCDLLARNITDAPIGLFISVCDMDDVYDTKLRSKQNLCCVNNKYTNCTIETIYGIYNS
ncbi:uncharacterized protein LOC143252510 [Tachypleus tridentatus]|uniref:uncharacterized protein LOC143252510 n=1 Tax=Tachypleus tridentatus TaxID=6853 RepID=UPI003FD6B167